MKVVYIAHPVKGNIIDNLISVRSIIRSLYLSEKYPNTLFIAPYFLDVFSLDENDPSHREIGMKNNREYFESGFVQEMWIYGRVSDGIRREIDWCKNCNIPVYFMPKNGIKIF